MTGTRTSLPDRGELGPASVIAALGAKGPMSRAQLARALRVSPATITQVTKSLLSLGVITELDVVSSGGGRPAQLLGLVDGAGVGAIGAKVTADHVTMVQVGLDGAVRDILNEPFDPSTPDALDVLARLLAASIERYDGLLLGIGVGVPGTVDDQASGVVQAPTLGWREVPVGTFLRRELDLPVLVDNDVNTLAVAERLYGTAGSHDSALIVTIGRGIGCGIVVDGNLHRGAAGGAGEIGHFPVAADGPVCGCGNTGCLEAFIGDEALVRTARETGAIGPRSGKAALRRAADEGDAAARSVFADAGALLGRTLAGVVHTVAPEIVVVLGEGTDCWPHWEESFERAFRRHLLPGRRSLPFAVESWSDERWAAGAAALVLHTPFDAAGASGDQGRLIRARLHTGSAAAMR
ncbi:ROK family transcriptional regulator [Occultella kanbiaonis]|uniref:ROK family transcriptional regulator n=1 Tax=Occultella kanbiaonis TaxID=2675754 RepID=UPI0012B96D2B|nr:ROK family transcriptional regulator [Occultella kanbiaonis]